MIGPTAAIVLAIDQGRDMLDTPWVRRWIMLVGRLLQESLVNRVRIRAAGRRDPAQSMLY